MITFDTDITVYCKRINGRQSDWIAAKISACTWHGKQGATIGDNGLQTADQYTVRIRESSMQGYVSPDVWRVLRQIPDGAWTVQSGDVIVKGLVDDSMVNGITDITGKYTDCFTVTGMYDNRRGFKAMRHLRIEGK